MKIFEMIPVLRHKHFRFLTSSVIVTASDYIIFFLLVNCFGPVVSNICSYSVAICISFYIQKKYVFDVSRSAHLAFGYVIMFSLLGISLSTGILFVLNYLLSNVIIAKVVMTITMFFYNFHTKQIAFGDKKGMGRRLK
jgi:putative flippase GtrA